MTDKQYAIYRAKGTKIYDIRIVRNRFVLKEDSIKTFDESWIARNWLNKSVVYDTIDHANCIHATEDKIEECKKKLYYYIKKECADKLKEAQKKMDDIEKLGKKLFKEDNNEETNG